MTHNTRINFLSKTGLSKTKRLLAGLIVILLSSLLFAGCSTPEKRLEKEHFTLIYRPQSSLISEIAGLRLDHPIEITKEQMTNHLLSLHYEELSLTGKKRYVFSPDDVLEITPLVTKALNRMKANTVLYFEVDSFKGITAGTVFRAKGKINWRFKKLKGVDFAGKSSPGRRGSAWRLIPRDGQSYKQSKKLFGNNHWENWIVSDLDLPTKSKRKLRSRPSQKSSRSTTPVPKRDHDQSPSADQDELKKRLQFLKDLRDKELIDDVEYERKRKELLDKFL